MTETEIPQLHFTRDHIMAMTQLLTLLSQRLAEQRERRGRARLQQRRARRPTRRHPRAPGGPADERGRAPGVQHPSR